MRWVLASFDDEFMMVERPPIFVRPFPSPPFIEPHRRPPPADSERVRTTSALRHRSNGLGRPPPLHRSGVERSPPAPPLGRVGRSAPLRRSWESDDHRPLHRSTGVANSARVAASDAVCGVRPACRRQRRTDLAIAPVRAGFVAACRTKSARADAGGHACRVRSVHVDANGAEPGPSTTSMPHARAVRAAVRVVQRWRECWRPDRGAAMGGKVGSVGWLEECGWMREIGGGTNPRERAVAASESR